MKPVPDLRPCDRCGYTHPRRMIALMSLWFARFAELPVTGGYFYLCPRCYGRLIEPHAEEIIHRLVEQHPFLHSRTPVRHYHAEESVVMAPAPAPDGHGGTAGAAGVSDAQASPAERETPLPPRG